MERSTSGATVNALAQIDTEALLQRLQALQAQVTAIGYPRSEDLVANATAWTPESFPKVHLNLARPIDRFFAVLQFQGG